MGGKKEDRFSALIMQSGKENVNKKKNEAPQKIASFLPSNQPKYSILYSGAAFAKISGVRSENAENLAKDKFS